jgi:DNA-binding transcriptional MerR regulator
VNPGTGYRYYSAYQIPAAQVIRRLRDLEMPVADVKAVLAAPDAPARNALIAAHLNRLEAELAQTRAAVESLRTLLQPPDDPAAIEHRSVPATAAVAIGAVVNRADALAWWQGALGELRATIRAQGLHATGPSGGVFASELIQQDRGQATVFIPVPGRVHPIGRVTPLVIPAAADRAAGRGQAGHQPEYGAQGLPRAGARGTGARASWARHVRHPLAVGDRPGHAGPVSRRHDRLAALGAVGGPGP